ncbi:unnamed protein product [Staurois parvus]|uniref:Uncharacterized protein n=1 Tax=Staurois parvus TaxID=386267 RepID=A0ABN9AQJ0_9NEOB|nr:unnamed protein product [Staurois parvus]
MALTGGTALMGTGGWHWWAQGWHWWAQVGGALLGGTAGHRWVHCWA